MHNSPLNNHRLGFLLVFRAVDTYNPIKGTFKDVSVKKMKLISQTGK